MLGGFFVNMQLLIPSPILFIMLIVYPLLIAILTYFLISNKKHLNTDQLILAALVLWFLPILGPVIISIVLFKKRQAVQK
jgi:hypothetical protein